MCGEQSQQRKWKKTQEAQHLTNSINTFMLCIIFKLLKTKDKKMILADWGKNKTLCRGEK